MTDEERARELLVLAAELPDSVQPPVRRLVELARAKRTTRAGLALVVVTIAVVGAATLPFALRGQVGGKPRPAADSAPPGLVKPLPGQLSGPSAAELSRFRWSRLPASPLGPRSQPLLAWTGSELIELGGMRKGSTISDGAAFDIATRRWHRITPLPNTIGLTGAVSVWTGHELFVTNGLFPSDWAPAAGAPAGLYNPATNRWSATLLPRALAGLQVAAVVWTGRDVVLAAAGAFGNGGRLAVAA